jgi:hypothetical protein
MANFKLYLQYHNTTGEKKNTSKLLPFYSIYKFKCGSWLDRIQMRSALNVRTSLALVGAIRIYAGSNIQSELCET